MIVISTDKYRVITADTYPYVDYNGTANLYSPPSYLVDRAPDDDPVKTWKRRRFPKGKRIYQLGIEVPIPETNEPADQAVRR